jgi:hypothetical protein
MTDYLQASNSVKETMKKAGLPLTDDQEATLDGSLFVWFDHFYSAGRRDGEAVEVDNAPNHSGT